MSRLTAERIDQYGERIHNESRKLPGHKERMKALCDREEKRQNGVPVLATDKNGKLLSEKKLRELDEYINDRKE